MPRFDKHYSLPPFEGGRYRYDDLTLIPSPLVGEGQGGGYC